MPVIDINARFGAYPSRHRTASYEKLSLEAEALGIDRSCACSTTGIFFDDHEGNLETISASAALARRIVPVATFNPASTLDPSRVVEEIAAGPFKLVRFFPVEQGWPIDFAPFARSLQLLAGRGLSVMLSCSRRGDATQLGRIVQGLGIGGVAIILDSVDYHTLPEALSVMQENPSLVLETHSLRFAGGLAAARDAIGANRIVFGSGAAVQSLGAALNYVRSSALSEGEKAQVLGDNAASLLKL